MQHNNDGPISGMTEQAREILLDNVETGLETTISSAELVQYLLHIDVSTVYPDEAVALAQVLDDLEEVRESVRRRREDGSDYSQPERIEELFDKYQED